MTSTRLQSKCDPITDVTFASPVLYSSDHAAVCTVITHACSYVPCGRLKMLLADPTHSYHIHMETSVRKYLRKWVECNGDQMQKTPCGLCWLQKWGSLRYSLTTALLAAIFSKHYPSGSDLNREWAMQQLGYALGDNPFRMSYMVGYAGADGALTFPMSPHHRSASCATADPTQPCNTSTSLCTGCANPWILQGALLGGPDESDCWVDDRINWERNEVALDYSAPMPGLLAFASVQQSKPVGQRAQSYTEWLSTVTFTAQDASCIAPPRTHPFAAACLHSNVHTGGLSCPFKTSQCQGFNLPSGNSSGRGSSPSEESPFNWGLAFSPRPPPSAPPKAVNGTELLDAALGALETALDGTGVPLPIAIVLGAFAMLCVLRAFCKVACSKRRLRLIDEVTPSSASGTAMVTVTSRTCLQRAESPTNSPPKERRCTRVRAQRK